MAARFRNSACNVEFRLVCWNSTIVAGFRQLLPVSGELAEILLVMLVTVAEIQPILLNSGDRIPKSKNFRQQISATITS